MIPDSQAENTYVILDAADVSSVDFSAINETSKYTLRYNLDKTKFIVKYSNSTPSFLNGKTTYTHEEINSHISDPINGWYDPEEI